MKRELEFKMERSGLVKEGDRVELKEDTLNTMAGIVYYYTIRPAVAMSNNIKEKVPVLSGTVKEVKNKEGVYTVTVIMDEAEKS